MESLAEVVTKKRIEELTNSEVESLIHAIEWAYPMEEYIINSNLLEFQHLPLHVSESVEAEIDVPGEAKNNVSVDQQRADQYKTAKLDFYRKYLRDQTKELIVAASEWYDSTMEIEYQFSAFFDTWNPSVVVNGSSISELYGRYKVDEVSLNMSAIPYAEIWDHIDLRKFSNIAERIREKEQPFTMLDWLNETIIDDNPLANEIYRRIVKVTFMAAKKWFDQVPLVGSSSFERQSILHPTPDTENQSMRLLLMEEDSDATRMYAKMADNMMNAID